MPLQISYPLKGNVAHRLCHYIVLHILGLLSKAKGREDGQISSEAPEVRTLGNIEGTKAGWGSWSPANIWPPAVLHKYTAPYFRWSMSLPALSAPVAVTPYLERRGVGVRHHGCLGRSREDSNETCKDERSGGKEIYGPISLIDPISQDKYVLGFFFTSIQREGN